ncbi:hypothetical protein NIES2100_17410 [Calothrix sp. NIES-2100]|uniref:hypothetical protein n=1 Tax=Calothrix sp. NIES-2100 TaxID=1954172 RepID=UPI000B5FCBBB|nr:hypothetical protein NIES2100_17410 [Calothrix sp. NIES-2100]
MKYKLQKNHCIEHKQNIKFIQLSNLTELTDQEAEIVVGGWGDVNIDDRDTEKSSSSGSW